MENVKDRLDYFRQITSAKKLDFYVREEKKFNSQKFSCQVAVRNVQLLSVHVYAYVCVCSVYMFVYRIFIHSLYFITTVVYGNGTVCITAGGKGKLRALLRR